MSRTRLGKINDLYELQLTHDRVEFHAKRPGWEAERLASCAELMQPGMCVFDAGSECGDFSSWYQMLVGPGGMVIPIEPSPPYWPAIRTHWEANDLPVRPLNAFWGGFVSDVDDFLPDSQWATEWGVDLGDGWPACSVGPIRPDFGFRHLAQQTADTPQIRIDTLVDRIVYTPDVLVLDVEGSEWHVLQGARRTLERDRPICYVSVHPPTMLDWYQTTPEMITQFMADLEYDETFLGEGTERFMLYTPR